MLLSAYGKTYEDYFLSKCECEENDYHNPNCDFSALSKDKLRLLVDKLLSHKIVCIKSYDKFYSPSFTSSFGSFVSEELIDAINSKDGKIKAISQQKAVTGAKVKMESDEMKSGSIVKSASKGKKLPIDVTSARTSCELDGHSCLIEGYGIEYLFPTTLMTNDIIYDDQGRKFNQQLKDLLLELEEEDDGCKFNLHGGYRSQDEFLSRPEPAVQWLKSQIIPRVQTLLSLSNSTQISFLVDGWGAVLRSGHGQNVHVHPGSMYAGVYYVAAPKEVETQPAGKSFGCLRFLDPRMGAAQAQVVRGKNIYGDAVEICPPSSGGLLVMFPSWVMHQVIPMPDKYKGPRIAISFNVIYQP